MKKLDGKYVYRHSAMVNGFKLTMLKHRETGQLIGVKHDKIYNTISIVNY